MKPKQVVALIAGATLGMGAVTLGVILARKEGREAARRFAEQYGELGQRGSQVAQSFANQARQVGGQVAKTATEQYKAQLPKAKEVFNNVIAQAPQAAGALAGVRARASQNGKHTTVEGTIVASEE
ncbi:MAG: hypothetical protein IVW57_17900 [Ktedonobacterales bacterium]|nr:hypothetical protein [Ktedonobacterales bacterium]